MHLYSGRKNKRGGSLSSRSNFFEANLLDVFLLNRMLRIAVTTKHKTPYARLGENNLRYSAGCMAVRKVE